MEEDLCTFVNALCPSDLCVLPYGHPWATRHRHITSCTYGSANTSWEEQKVILRTRKSDVYWHPSMHYLAPKGTSADELIQLGCDLQDELFPQEEQ